MEAQQSRKEILHMDNLLVNGDMVMSADGSPEMISGLQELIQRAMLRLTMAKGAFAYQTELGSTLFDMDLDNTDEFALLACIREALSDLTEITVTGVEKSVDRGEQILYITVYMNVSGKDAMLELNHKLW